MTAYQPLYIKGNTTGLVQDREEFILPADAYPTLENAFVWRERIKRKQGYELLGRLRRVFTTVSIGNSGASPWTVNILATQAVKGNITAITNFNPGAVTTGEIHNLVTGDKVVISGVSGMTQVNGNTFTITNTGVNSFTIGVDTTLFGVYTGGGIWANAIQPIAEIQPGSVVIVIGAITFTDQGNGTLTSVTPGNSGTIIYTTGSVTLTHTAGAGVPSTASFNYYPSIPVMGIRTRDLSPINNEMTVFFDTTYSYNFSASGFVEFIPGTTWSGNLTQANSNFFWSTNYWMSDNNVKLFWVTNFSGTSGDPIRYTNGVGNGTGAWIDFAPAISDPTLPPVNRLQQCLAILPFRGRLVAFNTFEGATLGTATQFSNRIRWAAIGNPISDVSAIVTTVNAKAWRDDIRGQGGFLDIPTNEDIVTVGFVRDNLVIYCENSTWQLRYTGRSISPFQIEKVNTELGAASTFSAIQFDTSLVGIGDKGVVECDSFKSERIDIKIPDLVMNHINTNNFGQKRVHGIRDFLQRLAFWTYPETTNKGIFPDRRLVYNYENDSWAIFTDSLTTLGTFQPISKRTWADPAGGMPSTKVQWQEANFPWFNRPSSILAIVGGNQQGYIEYLDQQTTNDESLTITAITGNTTTPTQITSANHNLQSGAIISISDIPIGTPFASSLNNPQAGLISNATQTNPCQITSTGHNLLTGNVVLISGVVGMIELNNKTFTITVIDANNFTLNNTDSTAFTPYASGGTWVNQAINAFMALVDSPNTFFLYKYSPSTLQFSDDQLDAPATYIGGGQIHVRDNFSIVSKKFNFLDEGQNIQIGHIDILMDKTDEGAITLNVFVDYDDNSPSNNLPNNNQPNLGIPDTFFNITIPTTVSSFGNRDISKSNQRVFCPTRGNYITIEYTLSNAQMNGIEQENNVQIDMQVLWHRPAGRIGNI